ncbi:2'-5' RNA ligase family protein [Pseudomaricurvus sp. HS19]|uniref:2'-5' RNA ligase family protein n=1 Tax=Pseudomaricurvus sp. HS19 TaxID=2692626 RepID=UPI00137159BF|nr:2'-5' RNA ligase family protein [Pseudomaricurvus sp. HS19]MYM63626.1 hypothetical protein [Pseudomaricurvus sp. HS19]
MPLFPEVWQRFLKLPAVTAVSASTDDAALRLWHRGRQRYWVWAVEVADPQLLAVWQQCREQLQDWLLPGYRRQPHITLAVAGFPLCPLPGVYNDSFTPQQLAICEARLQAARVAPFEVRVGAINSFAAAPFLEVDDWQGGLQRLRQQVVVHRDDFREEAWCPHLTLGYYRRAFTPRQLLPALLGCSPPEPFSLQVNELCLMSYGADEVGGVLCPERRYRLSD